MIDLTWPHGDEYTGTDWEWIGEDGLTDAQRAMRKESKNEENSSRQDGYRERDGRPVS